MAPLSRLNELFLDMFKWVSLNQSLLQEEFVTQLKQ